MKTRRVFLVFAALAAFLQASGKAGPFGEPSTSAALIIPVVTSQQTGNAVLSVASGLPTQPATVNPLAGKGVVLFKESFGGFLKRKGNVSRPTRINH
ncbi:MAG: hypothetical protein ACR2H6_00365 [Pyrinomonadaceae bacterium]